MVSNDASGDDEAGITKGDLQKGHFRCDANVSLAAEGQPLGTCVELKNINSFRFLKKAIEHEIERQTKILKSGQSVQQSTRSWTDQIGRAARKGRRIGLPILSGAGFGSSPHCTEEIDTAKKALPGLPLDVILDGAQVRLQRFQDRYGLDEGCPRLVGGTGRLCRI